MRTTEFQSREGEPTIDDMRYDLAEHSAMNMGVSHIIEILLDGVEGCLLYTSPSPRDS